MSDDRPSIAELQAAAKRRMGTTTLDDYSRTGQKLIGAAPVLLEIVAAALAFVETQGDRVEPEWGELTLALSMVRE